MTIGDKIKEIRINKGLSIRSFSRIVGVSYGYISKLEKGFSDSNSEKPISPSIDVLKLICTKANYDFRSFLEETGFIVSILGLSKEDNEILSMLRGLSVSERQTIINMIKGLNLVSSSSG